MPEQGGGRRVRRWGLGFTTHGLQPFDNSLGPLSTRARQGSPTRSFRELHAGTITNIVNERLVNQPKEQREGKVLSEAKIQDRTTFYKVHDRLHVMVAKQSTVTKVLQSLDTEGKGSLPVAQLHEALERLRTGLSEEERERVLSRATVGPDGRVAYGDFITAFRDYHPLGHPTPERHDELGVMPAPWEKRKPKLSSSWGWKPQQGIPLAQPGAPADEQRREDKYLLHFISPRLAQRRDAIKLMFQSRPGEYVLERDQFIAGIERLRLASLERRYIERLYELSDQEGRGAVAFEDFMAVVDGTLKPKREGTSLRDSLGLSGGSLTAPPGGQRVHELRTKLYRKGPAAAEAFKRYDVEGEGRLSLDQMTQACELLVPGVQREDVAALMLHADSTSDGQMRYRDFMRHLADESGSSQRAEEREAQLRTSGATVRSGWGDSPVWNRPVTPRSLSLTHPLALDSSLSPSPHLDQSQARQQHVHNEAMRPVLESLDRSLKQAGLHVPSPLSLPVGGSHTAPATPTGSTYGGGLGDTAPPLRASTAGPLGASLNRIRHNDTRFITTADRTSGMHSARTFVRKTDAAYLSFQQEDKQRHELAATRSKARFERSAAYEQQRTQGDTQAAERLDAANMAVSGLMRRRYDERAHLSETAREAEVNSSSPMFARCQFFHEHVWAHESAWHRT